MTSISVVPAAFGIDSGTMPVVSASTVSRTSASLRSRVPRMYPIPRASSSASVRAPIMPRSATTQNPADTEARTQAVDHRQQRLDVGDVARPGFRAEGTAVAVDDHADHHLFQFRPVVLGLAAPPERLATLAVEVEGGGIEEHQVEVVERVASSREQPLLHQVLDRPRRPGASLLVGQLLTQPGDRPVQVVQVDAVEPGNPVALRPLVAGPVGAGDAQPVQHAGEDRPLHRGTGQRVADDVHVADERVPVCRRPRLERRQGQRHELVEKASSHRHIESKRHALQDARSGLPKHPVEREDTDDADHQPFDRLETGVGRAG